MPQKTTDSGIAANQDANNTGFVLKHRIVGAAILLFFGALFLPWLLGPPDDVSERSSQLNLNTAGLTVDEKIDRQLIKAIEEEQLVSQEQVYISKITPLDNGVSKPSKASPKPKQPLKNNAKPVKDKPKKVNVKENKLASKQVKTTSEKRQLTDVKQPNKIVSAKPSQPKVDVGWIVSVGVFSDKKNVTAVMKDLNVKGFKPSTSSIDTNKGLATRVWLGPFAQRVDAAKAKARLKQQTGEPGLIKAYP